MAIDSTVELYAPTKSRADDGTIKTAWVYSSPNDVIIADVQPKGLTQAQIQLWGIDVSAQDAKVAYDFSFSTYWVVANRARVDGDKLYKIMSVNLWNSHVECLLIPLVGS
jgi:hypothetical protein